MKMHRDRPTHRRLKRYGIKARVGYRAAEDPDDLERFFDIHLARYYDRHGRMILSSEATLKHLVDVIFQGWMDFIAPKAKELTRITLAEKISLFASIELDYANLRIVPDETDQHADEELTAEDRVTLDRMSRPFWFLPERWRSLIWISIPALTVFGIDMDRFKENLDGLPVSEGEQELFGWGCEILELLLGAHKLAGTSLETRLTQEAVEVARLRMDSDLAQAAVDQMVRLIEELSHEGG